MLIDKVELTIKAGNGGDGSNALRKTRQTTKGGPDGGNGGNGGSVFVKGTTNLTDLREFRFKKKIKADDGIQGKGKNLYGKNAPDLTILVPLGTRITDSDSDWSLEITDDNPRLVAKGGKGGRGNNEFKSALNQTPRYAEKGEKGEEKILQLEMRIIAQIGLIGLPNAGKSSLLAAITNANPLIGDYPFTTLEPNIGMMERHAIADIPGLIEGASEGKGLGIQFLKHIEKTKILVHCIDVTSEHIEKDYEIVREEFKKFSELLSEKTEIVALNKIDLADEEKIKKSVAFFKKMKKQVILCSIYDTESIENLKTVLRKYLSE